MLKGGRLISESISVTEWENPEIVEEAIIQTSPCSSTSTPECTIINLKKSTVSCLISQPPAPWKKNQNENNWTLGIYKERVALWFSSRQQFFSLLWTLSWEHNGDCNDSEAEKILLLTNTNINLKESGRENVMCDWKKCRQGDYYRELFPEGYIQNKGKI